jgi:hypothetical protein
MVDKISVARIDITKTLGWFTIIYPVQLEVEDTIGDTTIGVK